MDLCQMVFLQTKIDSVESIYTEFFAIALLQMCLLATLIQIV